MGWVCPGATGGEILWAGKKLVSASVNGPLGYKTKPIWELYLKALGYSGPRKK